jgi:hypothetical protein
MPSVVAFAAPAMSGNPGFDRVFPRVYDALPLRRNFRRLREPLVTPRPAPWHVYPLPIGPSTPAPLPDPPIPQRPIGPGVTNAVRRRPKIPQKLQISGDIFGLALDHVNWTAPVANV